MSNFVSLLEGLSDHRGAHGVRYRFSSMIQLVLLGFLCGRDNLASIARFAKTLTREQMKALGFVRYRVPCHSRLTTFFRDIDVVALEKIFGQLVLADGQSPGRHIAMDGKRLRGSRHGESAGVHLLSCFCSALGGVVGQVRQAEGSNEITAALQLLASLELERTIVTGDAIFAQQEICRVITQKKATIC